MRTSTELHPHVHTSACLDGQCPELRAETAAAAAPPPAGRRTWLWLRSNAALAAAVLAAVIAVAASDSPQPAAAPSADEQPIELAEPAESFGDSDLNGAQQAVVDLLADKPTPNVVGMPLEKAFEALLSVGLKPDPDDATGAGRTVVNPLNWTVQGQDPPAGTPRAPGSEITLLVVNDSD